MAKKAKLPVALKKDSQEVCFVKDSDLCGFLRPRIKAKTGDIIEAKSSGKIGEHNGVEFYTIGQRVPVSGTGPYYVVKKDIKKNQLIVARKDDKSLYSKEIVVKDENWISRGMPKTAKVLVRTRYRQLLATARIVKHESRINLIFDKPQKSVTSGQSAVFYSSRGELLGGGIIV